MVVTLGRRSHGAVTPAQLLAECRARIRNFCTLARRLRHLVAEESQLFPSLSQLTPKEASAIVDEMKARRIH
jgi:hypothetical protein